MNSEDFEQELARRTIRPIPAQWRDGILNAAVPELEPPSQAVTLPEPWWRSLLWPSPRAWAGLATVWLVILFLNAGSWEPVERSVRQGTRERAVSPYWAMAMAEQKMLRAELLGEPETRTPEEKGPKPRSDAGSIGFRTIPLWKGIL